MPKDPTDAPGGGDFLKKKLVCLIEPKRGDSVLLQYPQ